MELKESVIKHLEHFTKDPEAIYNACKNAAETTDGEFDEFVGIAIDMLNHLISEDEVVFVLHFPTLAMIMGYYTFSVASSDKKFFERTKWFEEVKWEIPNWKRQK